MQRFLLTGVFLVATLLVYAQQQQQPTPGQLLRLARSTYEQGRLHEVSGQLDPVFKDPTTSDAERVEAFKLLCLASIYLEEPEDADDAMLNILRSDPYFKPNDAVDPAEFVALYNTFRTHPIYRIGAKLGVNATRPNVSESVYAVQLGADSEYKFAIALQFGAAADVPLTPKITLHGELLYQQRRFEIDLKSERGVDLDGNPLTNAFTGIESQTWLSLPVTGEYLLMGNKTDDTRYNPYVAAGVAIDYLLAATITSDKQRDGQQSIEEKKYEFKPHRESLNISAIGAVGIKTKVGGGYFVAEARYMYGLTNITSKETAFANVSYTLDQGYADSIFKLSSLSVTMSYVQNIFNPKKLTRKK